MGHCNMKGMVQCSTEEVVQWNESVLHSMVMPETKPRSFHGTNSKNNRKRIHCLVNSSINIHKQTVLDLLIQPNNCAI